MPLTHEEVRILQQNLEKRLKSKFMPCSAIELVWGMVEESLPKPNERIEIVSALPSIQIAGIELRRAKR
jgi:hypothetical protein